MKQRIVLEYVSQYIMVLVPCYLEKNYGKILKIHASNSCNFEKSAGCAHYRPCGIENTFQCYFILFSMLTVFPGGYPSLYYVFLDASYLLNNTLQLNIHLCIYLNIYFIYFINVL